MHETTTSSGPTFSTYEPYGPPDPDARIPEPRRPAPTSYDAADLPAAERPRGRFNPVSFMLQKLGVVNVVCISIWAMTGFGYFWPMWVLLGTGIPALLSMSTLNATTSHGICGRKRR